MHHRLTKPTHGSYVTERQPGVMHVTMTYSCKKQNSRSPTLISVLALLTAGFQETPGPERNMLSTHHRDATGHVQCGEQQRDTISSTNKLQSGKQTKQESCPTDTGRDRSRRRSRPSSTSNAYPPLGSFKTPTGGQCF